MAIMSFEHMLLRFAKRAYVVTCLLCSVIVLGFPTTVLCSPNGIPSISRSFMQFSHTAPAARVFLRLAYWRTCKISEVVPLRIEVLECHVVSEIWFKLV